MKNRLSAVVTVGILAILTGMAAWMWFGHAYHVSFKSEQLELFTVVRYDRAGQPTLAVGFKNRSPGVIEVLKSVQLRGPFTVHLVSAEETKELDRLPASLKGAPGVPMALHSRAELAWKVSLSDLYGELAPGNYVVNVEYDTAAAAKRGEKWVKGIDLGKTKSQPIPFEVKEAPASK